MRWLPWILLAGCAPASDGVILRGEPLESVPGAWFLWRTDSGAMEARAGLLIRADGTAEAVTRLPPSMAGMIPGPATRRRRGTVSPEDRSEILKALEKPLASPLPPDPEPTGGFGPVTEESAGHYVVEVRNPDGTIRRLRYQHRMRKAGGSGGEPLHPLLMRILQGLSE